MKNFCLIALLLATLFTNAQVNYSGTYAYSYKPQGDPPKEEADAGPTGTVTILRMEKDKYRFWLDINKGWPSYNMGATDGTLIIKNDTASFDNTHEGASSTCLIRFRFSGNRVRLSSQSADFNCGFGHGVSAEGNYEKLKEQPLLNNAWLKEQYFQSPSAVIITKKAEVFRDENCRYFNNQHFVKGDTLLAIAETELSVYTEYFTPGGKFIYGWLKKTALKIVETE